MLHVIGDSHTWAFGAIPGIKIHFVGSVLMFRVGRDGWSETGIEPSDTVIWGFGEIDCRCHVARIAERDGVPIQSVVQSLADAYIASILKAVGRPVVACVTPPSDCGHTDYLPVYGPLAQRVDVTRALNACLRENCRAAGIPFLDFYDRYANPDGSLDMSQSDGLLHIADGRWIREAFNQLMPSA